MSIDKVRAAIAVAQSTSQGVRFAGVTYRTQLKTYKDGTVEGGELSRYLLLLGCSVERAYRADLTRLQARLYRLGKLPQTDTLRQAAISELISERKNSLFYYSELSRLQSLENSQSAIEALNAAYPRQAASRETFEILCPGIKYGQSTGQLYLFGRSVSRTVIEPGIWTHVTKSKELTIAKDLERKSLPGSRWRLMTLDESAMQSMRLNGSVIEFDKR